MTERPSSSVNLLAVAREAGVSRATASLVLRESPLVAEKTRVKVQEAMKALGYIYNRGAANLRQRHTDTIGLVLSNIASPFFSALAAGVEELNEESDIVSFIANSAESSERQERQIQRLREHNVDGVIICPATGSDLSLLEGLKRRSLPFVQVLRPMQVEGYDTVTADYATGVRQAIDHFVLTGRQRIVFVGASRAHSAAYARLEGYRNAMTYYDLRLTFIEGRTDNGYDTEALDRLFSASAAPDALICYNDIIAIAVMNRLQSRGLKIGSDCAVIGMDDLPQAAATFPALTTVATHPREIGRYAARLLQARVAQPHRAPEQIVITPELILRASCAPTP